MESYIQYLLNLILKLPRIEKFSIGNEYKKSMYKMLENTLYITKISASKRLEYLNRIDSLLGCQRIYLRLMYENRWIDKKKFEVAIIKVSELGKMVGGLVKFYAKNYQKSV